MLSFKEYLIEDSEKANKPLTDAEARTIVGGKAHDPRSGLSTPSKMPGYGYGLSAFKCKTGAKLAKVPGTTCHKCYAKRGNYNLPAVKEAHSRRLRALNHPRWTDAMSHLINKRYKENPKKGGFFRWHDSGDIQTPEHLSKIAEIAKRTPGVQHWLPTREHKMVNDWLNAGNKVPENLNIRVSAHRVGANEKVPWAQEKGLTSSGVHMKGATLPAGHHECPAHKQGNKCGECRACWNKAVSHISYPSH